MAVCKKLLEVCEVPEEHTPLALEALLSDSQGGTFGKRGAKPEGDLEFFKPGDKFFKECGLPISIRTTSEEFKNLILRGTYKMKTEYDPPCKIYKRILAGSKQMGYLEVVRKFQT